MMQPSRATVENDSLSDVVCRLVVASHVEAGLGIIRIVCNPGSILDIIHTAEKTHTTSKVLSLSVEVKSILG